MGCRCPDSSAPQGAGAGSSLRAQQASHEVGWLTNKTLGHIIAQRLREGRGTALFRQLLEVPCFPKWLLVRLFQMSPAPTIS
ncbi:unnamed protein product [Gadus morhua 'NCC']